MRELLEMLCDILGVGKGVIHVVASDVVELCAAGSVFGGAPPRESADEDVETEDDDGYRKYLPFHSIVI